MRFVLEYVLPLLLLGVAFFGFRKAASEKHWPIWVRIVFQSVAISLFFVVVILEYFSGRSLTDVTREMIGSNFCKMFPISSCPASTRQANASEGQAGVPNGGGNSIVSPKPTQSATPAPMDPRSLSAPPPVYRPPAISAPSGYSVESGRS